VYVCVCGWVFSVREMFVCVCVLSLFLTYIPRVMGANVCVCHVYRCVCLCLCVSVYLSIPPLLLLRQLHNR
jgi:hypothetical protein